jgi:hypothetical protein
LGVEDLSGDGFRKAFAFWHQAKGGLDLPPVSAIDPVRIPRDILASIALISVEDGEKRMFVRLVGERVKIGAALNPTNQWGDDIKGGEDVLRVYLECTARRSPFYCEGPTAWSKHNFKRFNALLLPFEGPDGAVRRILTYLEFA